MLLNDKAISACSGYVYPFHQECVQPASYDIHLGDEYKWMQPYGDHIKPWLKQDHFATKISSTYILNSHEFVLATTTEKIDLPADVAVQVGGKSSLGRIGLMVHATAGFIDPGFAGNITLELFNAGPRSIKLMHGMAIGQLVYMQLVQAAEHPYQGKYQNQVGTTESRYHMNYEDDNGTN